jgi:hypothetical protein
MGPHDAKLESLRKFFYQRKPHMDYARIVLKLREQIIKFSGELSFGWPKVARRFIAEVVYGIQARQSVRLTEIARSLKDIDSSLKRYVCFCVPICSFLKVP